MFKYEKKLPYPINIRKKNVKLAKYIITQYGGYAGELGLQCQLMRGVLY